MDNIMKIEITKSADERIVVEIEDLGMIANFETFDDATKFIQSVITNIKSY